MRWEKAKKIVGKIWKWKQKEKGKIKGKEIGTEERREGKIETIHGKANANPHVYLAIIESSFHLHALSNIKEVNIAEVKP